VGAKADVGGFSGDGEREASRRADHVSSGAEGMNRCDWM
jgi:hypothetical protein